MTEGHEARAARFAALGDENRLAIVDTLVVSDRSPLELRRIVGIESNLLAHHLDVLESVGLIERSRSSGDGRRRYVHLVPGSLGSLVARPSGRRDALFVCTANSARSQLAAALWQSMTGRRAGSAGTHPAARVHRGAVAAARRAGLDLSEAEPRTLAEVGPMPDIVVTVCDRAHEELSPPDHWWHWSIPDPVAAGDRHAFDRVVNELRHRISSVTGEGATR